MSSNIHNAKFDGTDYTDNSFYECLFKDNTIPIILVQDYKIIDCNKEALKLFNIENPEMLVQKNAALLNNYIKDFYFDDMTSQAVSGKTEVSSVCHLCIDNQPMKLIEIKLGRYSHNNSNYYSLKLIDYDKTLKDIPLLLQTITSALNDGLWDWNLRSGEVYFSPVWFSMLGYLPNEFPHSYETWRSLLHPEDIPLAEQSITEHISKGKDYEVEFRMKTKVGGWKWIMGRGNVIEWDESGNALRMIGTHTDISKRKEAEEQNSIYQKRLEETNIELLNYQEQINQRIIALTQPLEDVSDINFSDLFDMDEIQKIQDAFSNATGVASIITLPDGTPLTKPSNFCRLCNDIIRHTEKGLHNCMLSDSIIGKNSSKGPNYSRCMSGGLLDGGAGIMIGDRQIANWLIGQVMDENADMNELLNYAEVINADKNDYASALKEVKRMDKDTFIHITETLYLIAKQLSNLAVQNVQQAREISRRTKAEEGLIEAEKKFKSAMNQLPGIIWTTDKKLNITQLLGQGLVHLNFSANDYIGMNLSKFYGSDNPHYYPILLHKSALEGSAAHFEFNFGFHIYSCEVEPLRNARNEVIGSLGIAIDISDRKSAEEALKYNLKRFNDVTNAAGEFVWETDNNMNFSFCTNKIEEVLGYYKNELIGKGFKDILFLDDKGKFCEKLDYYTGSKQEFQKLQARFVDKDGNIIWLNISGTPIYNEYNDITGYRGTGLDITTEKNLETEREELIESLELKNAEMERFTYTVSHDLRSPLITIKGFIGMLAKDIENNKLARVQDDIKRISGAADKMQNLLEDLLELSRVGRVINPPELIDLPNLINEIKESLSSSISQSNAAIIFDEKLPPIWGDKLGIKEVFQNIIENAVKFRKEGEQPQISINYISERLVNTYIIKDNGIGIEKEYLDKVFGLFEKLNQNAEGTGVGLAIVKRVIEIHKGKIFAISEGLGKGTEFYISLPNKII